MDTFNIITPLLNYFSLFFTMHEYNIKITTVQLT